MGFFFQKRVIVLRFAEERSKTTFFSVWERLPSFARRLGMFFIFVSRPVKIAQLFILNVCQGALRFANI